MYIVAFAGRKQSGKTSSSEYVCKEYYKLTGQVSRVYNFADPLKQLCQEIFGLTYEQCYGEDLHKNELVDCYLEGRQLSAREVMQVVGTDMFRSLKNNVWVEATLRKIKSDALPLSVIADCRFPNEVMAVKDAGGVVIKLNRNPYNSYHSSETSLDENNYDQNNFDLIIDNSLMSISNRNSVIYKFLKEKGVL